MRRTIWTLIVWMSVFMCVSCSISHNSDIDDDDGKIRTEQNDEELVAGDESLFDDTAFNFSPIGWNDITPLGSPAGTFGDAAGTCTAPLILETASESLTPASAQTEMTVTLTVDESSAVYGTRESVADTEDEYATTALAVSGMVKLATADGVLVDEGPVTLTVFNISGDELLNLEVPFESIGGTLAFTPEDENHTPLSLQYRMSPPGRECSGEVVFMEHWTMIDHSEQTDSDVNVAATGMGRIAAWSDTGCEAGSAPVDIAATYGAQMIQQIEEDWAGLMLEGAWDSGADDALSLNVALSGTVGCKPVGARNIVLPATVTYGTRSGMLPEATLDAQEFSVIIDESGALERSRLDIDDRRECTTGNELDGYGFGTCDTLSGIIVQLGLNQKDGTFSVSDEGLMVFEYAADTPFGGMTTNNRAFEF
jgi:hypothetical protein